MVAESTDGHRRDRAQLILIAAILVALTVVAAVVLLNVVHQSPGLSAQQESQSVDDAQQVTRQVQNDLRRLFLVRSSVSQAGTSAPYAYELSSPHDDSQFGTVVEDHSGSFSTLLATSNRGVVEIEYVPSTAPDGSTSGSAAVQDTEQRFTNPSVPDGSTGDPRVEHEYYVVEEADTLPRFYVEVTDAGSSPVEFVIEGDSGGQERLEITQADVTLAGDTYGGFDDPSDPDTAPIEADFTDGVGELRQTGTELVGNETFGRELTPPYSVKVDGGDNAAGNYTITAAGDDVDSTIKDDAPSERAAFDVDLQNMIGGTQGDVAQFQTEVDNLDSFEDTQYVVLEDEDGNVLAAKNVTLAGGDTVFTFEWTPDGEYANDEEFTVRSWTDSDTETFTITPDGTPSSDYEFVDSSTSIDDSPLQAGGKYTVQVEVRNNGGFSNPQNVSLENFGGDVVNTTTVDPAAGNTEQVDLTWDTPANGTAESGYLNVTTEDDEWNSSEVTLNPTQPFVYDSEMTPSIDQDPIVNPTFEIVYRTPDISYRNRFALYNRTVQ